MNKLYMIEYRMPNKYNLHTAYFWNPADLEAEMVRHPEFEYELKENNYKHMIFFAD